MTHVGRKLLDDGVEGEKVTVVMNAVDDTLLGTMPQNAAAAHDGTTTDAFRLPITAR